MMQTSTPLNLARTPAPVIDEDKSPSLSSLSLNATANGSDDDYVIALEKTELSGGLELMAVTPRKKESDS